MASILNNQLKLWGDFQKIVSDNQCWWDQFTVKSEVQGRTCVLGIMGLLDPNSEAQYEEIRQAKETFKNLGWIGCLSHPRSLSNA